MKESGLILNQQNPLSLRTRFRRKSSIFFDTVKQYNEKMTEQFNSGESSFIFGINFHKTNIGWMIVGKHAWQQEEDQKEDISIVLIIPGTIVYLRALQGHSGRSLIDPSLQDNVIIQCGFFQHIYHIGCVFYLHPINNNGLIPGGQDSSRRQTVFFLPIDPRDKGHQDPAHIDFSVPRRAQYLHSAWKKHQDAVFWVDINLAIRKGIDILSNSIECNYPSRNTSSLLYSKSCEIEDWRSLI